MRRLFLITGLLFLSGVLHAQNLDQQLLQAIKGNDTLKVESLLKKGADANYKEKVGAFSMGVLMLAVNKDEFKCVKLLVENKAKVDERDMFNSTALMYAADIGNLDIINYLVAKGADVHADDGKGNTVLSAAKEGKHQDAIQLIEKLLKQ